MVGWSTDGMYSLYSKTHQFLSLDQTILNFFLNRLDILFKQYCDSGGSTFLFLSELQPLCTAVVFLLSPIKIYWILLL